MAENTKIEWADDTVNPWWGCAKVSPACTHCYAETFAKRTGRAVWGPKTSRWARIPAAKRDLLKSVRKAQKEGQPRRVFMCSMADIFEQHPELVEPRAEWWAFLHEVAEMRFDDGRPAVIPLILTKRPEAMAAYAAEHGWPSNAWAGTTVEDQKRADERIPHLLRVPAPVRFLSLEPLLGPVDLFWPSSLYPDGPQMCCSGFECGCQGMPTDPWLLWGIDWLIIGGESGPKARPMHPEWARSLIAQGQEAGCSVLFKQWGAYGPADRPHSDSDPVAYLDAGEPFGWGLLDRARPHIFMRRLGKKAAGRVIDGRTWDEVPHG